MLYAVVGDGTGNKTEITQTLEDLRDKAAKDDVDFWLALVGKEDLTATDKAIVKWLQDNEVWYEVIGNEDEDTYAGAQAFHGAKDPYRKALAMLGEKAPDEGAVLLALYVDSEAEVEEDNALATMVERAVEDDIEVRLLNGQMVRVSFGEEDEAAEPEVEEDDVVPEDEAPVFSEAELKKMQVPELQAIAKGQGVAIKGLNKADLITALLSTSENGEDEPEPAPRATKAAARKAVAKAKVPDEDVEDEIDDVEAAASTLETRDEAKIHAAIVVFVDGAVTVLPVSIGHARAILAGKAQR